MHLLLELVAFLVIMGGLAFFQAPRWVWTPIAAAVLVVASIASVIPWWLLILFWLIYLAVALLFNVPYLRIHFLITPLFNIFHKVLPSMSKTEREALDAGDVWWDGDLFCGRPDWKKMLAMPKPSLSPEEQAFIDNQVETLCGMLDDWKITHETYDLPPQVWEYLKKERFLGMVISKKYGGLGFSAVAHSTVVAKLATRSISAAVDCMVPNSLGPGELLHQYGTEEQKNYYLPRLARGEEIPCFALTAPDAGSDAASMHDTGFVCYGTYEGKKVLGMRITWDKRYITLAPIATVLGLAFKLYDPEHLIGSETDVGITVCLIPTSHPGVEIGKRHFPLNMAFLNGPTRGKDVFVPLDWIVGGAKMAGQGWRMLMECLSIGRGISLPALATATGKFCYRTTGAYAMLRRQFKLPIAYFEGVEEALAKIAGYTYMLEASRVMSAGAVDQKVKPTVISAVAKYHMTEMSRWIINHAMDIHGGRGIQMGPRNYLARCYEAIPISITVEGANILTRNLIIFGQGAIRCHPYVHDEMQVLADKNSVNAILVFDKLLTSHIGYAISNFVRAIYFGLTGGRLQFAPVRGETARYYRQLTRMSTALALVSDIAMMLLGGELKRKERLSARLGDVLSYLYLGSAVLKYYQDNNCEPDDLPSVHWALKTCLQRIQHAFYEFFANFPVKGVGGLLKFLIFPLGRSYKAPTDKLSHQIASKMLSTSHFRDRITQYCYIGKSADDPTGRIENAFIKMLTVQKAEKKFHETLKKIEVPHYASYEEQVEAVLKTGAIDKAEATLLCEFEAARLDAMQVDEFNSLGGRE